LGKIVKYEISWYLTKYIKHVSETKCIRILQCCIKLFKRKFGA